jgi:hypothetical protein
MDVLGIRNSNDRKPLLRPGEDRRPTLTWPCQIPFVPEPDGVVKVPKEFARGEAVGAVPMSLEMLLCSDVSPIIP